MRLTRGSWIDEKQFVYLKKNSDSFKPTWDYESSTRDWLIRNVLRFRPVKYMNLAFIRENLVRINSTSNLIKSTQKYACET